jgi:hypothetical protein
MTTAQDEGLTCHLAQLVDDMIEALRLHFPTKIIHTVTNHEGDFGDDEIERYSTKANALVLSSVGSDSVRQGGVIHDTNVFDLFIFIRGVSERERTRGSYLVKEHLLKLLHNQDTWNNTDECVQSPRDVKARNLYGPKTDGMGVSLWAVRWTQLIEIPFLDNFGSLDNFARLFVDYLRVGETDPTNTIAEQQIDLPTV